MTPELIAASVAGLLAEPENAAAIVAAPVTDTIKRSADGVTVDGTVPRAELFAVQTPQVFRRDWLERALGQPDEVLATADRRCGPGGGARRPCGARAVHTPQPQGDDPTRCARRRDAARQLARRHARAAPLPAVDLRALMPLSWSFCHARAGCRRPACVRVALVVVLSRTCGAPSTCVRSCRVRGRFVTHVGAPGTRVDSPLRVGWLNAWEC